MKKVTVFAAMLIFCAHSIYALAQEPPDDLNPEFSVVSRLESNPYHSSDPNQWSHSFGSSSLYMLLDGTFADNFSYSVSTHLLAGSKEEIRSLYESTLRSDTCNWLDWANLSYTIPGTNWGSLGFTAGKAIMGIGTFEMDEYDFNSYTFMSSYLWNMLNVYLWGGSVFYTTPSEKSTFMFQMSSSPYAEKIFQDGLYAMSVKWTGDYGPYSAIGSLNMLQVDKGDGNPLEMEHMAALGNKLTFGNFSTILDFSLRTFDMKNIKKENSELGATLSFKYEFGDKFDATIKGGLDYICGIKAGLVGGAFQYYPLKESKDLRIHLAGGWNQFDYEGLSLNNFANICIGVTYNFNVSRLIHNSRNK